MKNIKTMKKKRAGKSVGTADPEDPEQSVNYLVGQVSGSLFPSKPTKKSSSLSSLFKTETPSASLIFVPAPKPAPKRPEPSVEESDGNTEETSAPPAKKTKPSKEKSAAEKKVEDRESALKNAEDDEGRKKSPGPPRVKARRHGGTGPVDAEEGEQAGKKKAVNRAEERIKNKRTVFVGNLPVTCTKKVRVWVPISGCDLK
ncbi:RBM34 protein, partial [Amia calva]|nr:RBM34 protein [Amia calva]